MLEKKSGAEDDGGSQKQQETSKEQPRYPCGHPLTSAKRSKSNDSYHLSDEMIDEEELLAISEYDYLDNDIPIIPGLVSTANVSDVDSAFEDGHCSGSVEDKNKNRVSTQEKPNNSGRFARRYETFSGRQSGARDKSQRQIFEEMDQEEQGVQQDEDNQTCESSNFQLHEPELALFDMEVSPAATSQVGLSETQAKSNRWVPGCNDELEKERPHSTYHKETNHLVNDKRKLEFNLPEQPACTIDLVKESRCESDQSPVECGSPDSLKKSLLAKEDNSLTNGDNMSECPKLPQDLSLHSGSNSDKGNMSPVMKDGQLDEDFQVIYVVPDGGWGWMVLFGSIIVNILIPGVVKSFGVLFVEFMEMFKASPASAAWIPALSYWLYSSTGPFASALAIKFSYRTVTLVGGLLASFGLMLSYFATSVPFLCVSYGIIGGLGAGLAYPIGVLIVGQYFDNRRGLANGLCTSGSALGSVVIPPLLRYLLVDYGYKGTILIIGGILLNVCVGAMFYDPVSKHMKKVVVRKSPSQVNNNVALNDKEVIPVSTHHSTRQVSSPISRPGYQPVTREIAVSMPIAIPFAPPSVLGYNGFSNIRRGSGGRKTTFQLGNEESDSWSCRSIEVASPLAARLVKETTGSPKWTPTNTSHRPKTLSTSSQGSNSDMDSSLQMTSPPIDSGANVPSVTSRGQSRQNLTAIPEDDDDDLASENTSRQVDWAYFSSLPPARQQLLKLSVSEGTQLMSSLKSAHVSRPNADLPRTISLTSNASNSSFHYMTTIHHGTLLSSMQLDRNLPQVASSLSLKSLRNSLCPNSCADFCRKLKGCFHLSRNEDQATRKIDDIDTCEQSQPGYFKNLIDLSLLKDGIYLIMLASNLTSAIGYTNFIVLLPSYALYMGYSKSEAAYLLSVIAALDFVGRIGGAALSDLKFVPRKWFYIVGLLSSGVALSFLPFMPTYITILSMCGVFGLASGTYIGVTAVILADQLGVEKLGSSYGVSLFLNGLVQLIGPPACGLIVQDSANLGPLFTGLGVVLMFGALLWVFSFVIERTREQKLRRIEENQIEIVPNELQVNSQCSVDASKIPSSVV